MIRQRRRLVVVEAAPVVPHHHDRGLFQYELCPTALTMLATHEGPVSPPAPGTG